MEKSKITHLNKFAIIIGVGGAGCNALSYIYKNCTYEDIDFFALDTDRRALSAGEIPLSAKLLIGKNITHGNSADTDPEKGRLAAMESSELIKNKLEPNHYELAFIVTGMGGGTGTGAAPIIADICRSMNIYTIAICSTPFSFEGHLKRRRANEGVVKLKQSVDNIAIFSNDDSMNSDALVTASDAFNASDATFYIPIDTAFSIIMTQGLINLDFADIRATLAGEKLAFLAYGKGEGEKRVTKAFENIKKSPFLNHIKLEKSKKLLYYLQSCEGNEALRVAELTEVQNFIDIFRRDIHIIWGTGFDSRLKSNEIKVSVILTGITDEEKNI